MESSVFIDAKGKSDAVEVIKDNGYKDITEKEDFYSADKQYEKNGDKYFFGGWSKWNEKKREFKEIKMIKV